MEKNPRAACTEKFQNKNNITMQTSLPSRDPYIALTYNSSHIVYSAYCIVYTAYLT